MRHTAGENPFFETIHRSPLVLRLLKEAVLVCFNPEYLCQFPLTVGSNAGTEHQQIGLHHHLPTQDWISDSSRNTAIIYVNLRFVVYVVLNENHPCLPRLSVIRLEKSVGHNIPVKDIYIDFWILFF